MPKITIKVDPSACILAANCVGMEPRLFKIGLESYVELMDSQGTPHGTTYTYEASADEMEMAEDAVESCPTRAISMMLG